MVPFAYFETPVGFGRFVALVAKTLRFLLLSTFFAEDLQHKTFSGSVSKYSSGDNGHPDQSKDPPRDP